MSPTKFCRRVPAVVRDAPGQNPRSPAGVSVALRPHHPIRAEPCVQGFRGHGDALSPLRCRDAAARIQTACPLGNGAGRRHHLVGRPCARTGLRYRHRVRRHKTLGVRRATISRRCRCSASGCRDRRPRSSERGSWRRSPAGRLCDPIIPASPARAGQSRVRRRGLPRQPGRGGSRRRSCRPVRPARVPDRGTR